jgi:hypothetical protein
VQALVTVAVGTGLSAHEQGMVTCESKAHAGTAPHMDWPVGGVGDLQAGSRTDDVMVGHECGGGGGGGGGGGEATDVTATVTSEVLGVVGQGVRSVIQLVPPQPELMQLLPHDCTTVVRSMGAGQPQGRPMVLMVRHASAGQVEQMEVVVMVGQLTEAETLRRRVLKLEAGRHRSGTASQGYCRALRLYATYLAMAKRDATRSFMATKIFLKDQLHGVGSIATALVIWGLWPI